jgi:hypothetical protein
VTDIERRLKALEKRAALDYEAILKIDGRSRAYRLIFHAIGAPIVAAMPEILPAIIKKLDGYEREARWQNSHASTIAALRDAREIFQSLAKSIPPNSPSKPPAASPREK